LPNEITGPMAKMIECPTCKGNQLIYNGKPSVIIELLNGDWNELCHYQFRPYYF